MILYTVCVSLRPATTSCRCFCSSEFCCILCCVWSEQVFVACYLNILKRVFAGFVIAPEWNKIFWLKVASAVHCHQYISLFLFFFFTCTRLLLLRNTLKADFRLKCAPLFSFPSSFLFLPLLCYLLPIGLTLAHCSLAFCQSRFPSPTPSLFSPLVLFLLRRHAVSPSFLTLLFLLYPWIPPSLCVNPVKDSSGISSLFITRAIFLLHQSRFFLSFLPFFVFLISLRLSPLFFFPFCKFFVRN